jgi:hypothetical protein
MMRNSWSRRPRNTALLSWSSEYGWKRLTSASSSSLGSMAQLYTFSGIVISRRAGCGARPGAQRLGVGSRAGAGPVDAVCRRALPNATGGLHWSKCEPVAVGRDQSTSVIVLSGRLATASCACSSSSENRRSTARRFGPCRGARTPREPGPSSGRDQCRIRHRGGASRLRGYVRGCCDCRLVRSPRRASARNRRFALELAVVVSCLPRNDSPDAGCGSTTNRRCGIASSAMSAPARAPRRPRPALWIFRGNGPMFSSGHELGAPRPSRNACQGRTSTHVP